MYPTDSEFEEVEATSQGRCIQRSVVVVLSLHDLTLRDLFTQRSSSMKGVCQDSGRGRSGMLSDWHWKKSQRA